MKALFALTGFVSCLSSVLAAPATVGTLALERVVFPNYLVPIKEASPNFAFPTQFTAQINYTSLTAGNEIKLLVGFDVPPNVGTRCAIKFGLAPKVPGGYQWTVNGSGKLDVWSLGSIIQSGITTWNTKPGRTTADPQYTLTQPLAGGDAVTTGVVIPCLGGQRMDFEVAATRPNPTFFDWFELVNPKTGIVLNMYT